MTEGSARGGPRRELERSLDSWVERGLISRDQAEAISDFERGTPPERGSNISVTAEALGYLGGILIFIAVLVAAQEIWKDLGRGMRAGVLAVAALILLGVGGSVRSHPEPALRRLNSFLWFLSVAAAGSAIGIAADDPGPDEYQVALVAGLGTAIYGLILWHSRPTAAQQFAVFAGMLMSTQGIVGSVADDSSVALTIAYCAAGFGWMLLGRARLMTPVGTALVLGGIAALLGAEATYFVEKAAGLYLGILTAAIIVGASVAFRHTALLVIGVGGMFVFVTEGVFKYLGDSIGAGAALFVSGLLLLVAALTLARMRSLIRSPDATDTSGPSRAGGWP